MRIAVFSDSYKPYISGVTVSVETLARELRALGHRVYIFAPSYNSEDEDKDIIRFPSMPTSYPGFRLAIPYLKNFPEVDLIHSHSPFQTGLLARYLAGKRKIPLVYTFHTLFTRYVHYASFLPKRFSKLAIAAYIREFCKRVDLIIAPSQMSKRVLKKWGIGRPCEIVPTGIVAEERRRHRRRIREILGIPESAKVLVYLGRMSEEKNISFLLEAFKKMKRENLYLLMIGGGPLVKTSNFKLPARPARFAARRAGGQTSKNNVIFPGELEHSKALEYCAAGDIFAFASTTETQGLVLAEAKSLGLPVVAIFAGGLVDTVRSGIDGYLTPRNIDSFTEHIERLLDDDALRIKMGEAARGDAQERFSSKRVAKQIESLYNSLIRGEPI